VKVDKIMICGYKVHQEEMNIYETCCFRRESFLSPFEMAIVWVLIERV
jgi:hypothetical protein